MRLKQRETDFVDEPRYGTDTLRKVAALATRLQSQKQDTLTAREIEAIGAEAGLERTFIQQALAQLTTEQPQASLEKARKTEFWSLMAAWSFVVLYSLLAWTLALEAPGPGGILFAVMSPWPFAALLGLLTGKKRAGFATGIGLILALAPALIRMLRDSPGPFQPAHGAMLMVLGAPLAGWLGLQGAKIRDYYFPLPSTRLPVSRPALLNLLFTLQRQLEGQKQHRAFLSVDVVGSSEMKRSGAELAVEHSFGQYRDWVEEVVQAQGGEMRSAAGDGVMALFPTEAGALRAARQLQAELPRFNEAHNRLPLPFRIRCGVSAGQVAIEEGMPLGHLQSPVIDRAAALQKRAEPGDILVSGEVAAAAVTELGGLSSLPEPVAGEAAFSWRAGQSAHPPDSS